MPYMLLFLGVCAALGLWGPKKPRWVLWLALVGAIALVAFFLITKLHRD